MTTNKKRNLTVKNFKRVEKLKYKGYHLEIYVDRNNSVYEVLNSQKSSPKQFFKVREDYLFDKIKGNPYEIAVRKIMMLL